MGSAAQGGWKASLSGLPGTFWVLWAGTLVNRLGAFVLPFLTFYLTQHRGLDAAAAGGVVAAFGVGSLVANPLGGWLADRVGRKPTMLLGLVLGACAMGGLALARSLPGLFAGTLTLGLTMDLYRPASSAAIADLVPPKDRLRAFSHLYWAINLGAAVAPLVAGLVPKEHFFLLFAGDAATTLLCAALIAWKVPETRPVQAPLPARGEERGEQGERAGGGASGWQSLAGAFTDRAFMAWLFVSMLVATVFFQFLVAVPLAMTEQGLRPLDYSIALSLNGLLIVFLQPWVTEAIARRRRARVLAVSALLIGVGYGVNVLAGPLLWAWCVGVVLWTLGEILMAPVNAALVADLAPPEARGRYQGAFHMSWSVSWIAAPSLGGWVISRLGVTSLWVGCLVVGVLAAALQLAIAPLRRERMLLLHGRVLD